MTDEERKFFNKLVDTRQSFFDQIQEAEKVGTVEGYWDSVVDKYSDQAHFIYEILQNADDAQAKNAHFELYKDHLVFRHDGKRRFSVSNPDTYRKDRENNTVGDINGITSIGGSGKFLDDAKIGKFGLGFKAVFQYTLTPSIYDGNVSFKIHDYIVPEILTEDYNGRKDNETLFVFPFDRPDVPPQSAFDDIQEKLRNLIFPNLFLNNLELVTYECYGAKGAFKKEIIAEDNDGDISAQFIRITKGDYHNTDNMWLFSRNDSDSHKYSVGFFVNEKGVVKAPDHQYAAFCFFPTLVTTNLNFIIHAPFLLTDNREGIMAGNEHNKRMISGLAKLAADGLEYLCEKRTTDGDRVVDDSIIDIIPFQESVFFSENDRSKVSFMPFYNAIKDKFKTARVLPTRTGYTTMDEAYWADTEDIPSLISDEQLSDLLETDANFVFVTKGRNSTLHNAALGKGKYIDGIVYDSFDEDDMYRLLTPEFVETQEEEWLILFYRYILEGRNSATRISKIRKLPIFLDTNDKAISAYDNYDHECLFLPDEDETGYPTINARLFDNQHVKKLLSELDIKKPEQEHRIFNKIIPQYVNGVRQNGSTKADFKLFLDYYLGCESKEKEDDLIRSIKGLNFIEAISTNGVDQYVASPGQLYMPTDDLKEFFKGMDDVLFVDYREYEGYISPKNWKRMNEFLTRVGVFSSARRYFVNYTWEDYEKVKILYGEDWPHYTRAKYTQRKWKDARLLGGKEAVKRIVAEKDESLSRILWDQLVALFGRISFSWTDNTLGGIHTYPNYGNNYMKFDGLDAKILRETAWILNKAGEFVAPQNMLLGELNPIYNTATNGIVELLKYLEMVDEDTTNLSESQKQKIEFANKLLALGIDEDDLEDIKEFKRQRDYQIEYAKEPDKPNQKDEEWYNDDLSYDDVDESDSAEEDIKDTRISGETKRVIRDIARRTKANPNSKEVIFDSEEEVDEDEYIPVTTNYNKKIERAKAKSAAEIERITYWEKLQNKAENENKNNKYSFKWFNTLLEMESVKNGDNSSDSREVSISFAKVEREPGTKRTLVLKHPNRYIPHFMEDLADIPLVLHIGDQTKTVAIEVANIKSYSLRVKLKNGNDINGIDLDTVSLATIDAKSPIFLLEELRKQFSELRYDDGYNMRDNLAENIEFVFGPPGTGKTTHLAQKVLLPMMHDNNKCRVLVLTPTNKSADVLVRRIMEVSNDQSYKKWLVRFGTTSDEEIEQSPVYKDKTYDIRSLPKSVTVTTIARFPYDFFMPQGSRLYLRDINWDYIVIDEASMIPIANIVFPLYKKTPKKFIIAGDPFQIEPITSVDIWKNENIYTLVKLNSFEAPNTVPYQYNVELLTTQYRSVPDIGYIFSNFAYDGVLKHYRSADSQRPLNTGNDLGIETLNIIKYPVSKYESIYRCKRLQHSSSYQVYSALFVFEYVCYVSRIIADNNPNTFFKIGIIAPYRAQADMIDKLMASENLPKEVDVQVGTIHGFQGDECDIVFAVFNTPPTISDSNEMFLNKKNIINVSISRARDYLFVVMPDDNTENISKLRLIKRVEALMHSTDSWQEFNSPDLEELMFEDSHYLENNAFSTSHQSVNVYGLPEKRFEVRTEDTAVDVQLHKVTDDMVSVISEEKRAYPLTETNFHNLDESLVPAELWRATVELPVKGAINGWCYLVPYTGKLKRYTDKAFETMFIPLWRKGQKKMINVSVIKEDHIIFISEDKFRCCENALSEPEGIELLTSLTR